MNNKRVLLCGFRRAGIQFLLTMACALVSQHLSAHEHAATPERDVLVIHSYNRGFPWTDTIQNGIEYAFRRSMPDAELHVEYMDTKRHPREEVNEYLLALFQAKYTGHHIDAAIVSDNNAFDFMQTHGWKIFPGVPLIFCGLNNYDESMLKPGDNATGVVEAIDIPGTLEMILRLQPNVNKVAVIADDIPTGRLHLANFRQTVMHFAGRLSVIEIVNPTSTELRSQLQSLDSDTAVLLLSLYRDRDGVVYSANEGLHFVSKHSPRPVYCLWDFWVNEGAFGGIVTSGRMQGQAAAEMTIRILHGESASSIPVMTDSPNVPMFDYRALERFGISPSVLPANAVLLNRPTSLYETHSTLIWSAGLAFVVLFCLVTMLSLSMLRSIRAEKQLRAQKELIGNVLANVPHYVFWKDREGVYLGCNENFARAVGLENPEQITGLTDEDLPWPADHREDYQRQDREVMKNDCPALAIEEPVHFAQKSIHALTAKVPLHDTQGRVSGILGMSLDITARKRMQEELHQSQKLRAIGQLAGGIAHDFNNMLGGIMGAAELLQRKATPDQEKLLTIIIHTAEQAAELTRRLLAFSRKGEMRTTLMDLHQTARDALSILQRSLDRRIQVETVLAADAPLIHGDASQLQNAILNLAINARDAMENGGTLTVSSENLELEDSYCSTSPFDITPGPYIRLSVRDTGIGMPPDIQERIFEPFFTTKSQGKGTGLGLSAVYGCVRDHKGAITVYSEEGHGSIFHLFLPLASETGELPDPEVSHEYPHGDGVVLLVDDESALRETTALFLETLGYNVLTAENGEKGLRLFREHHESISVVLLDMVMPAMNGRDCFRAIRAIAPDARVILSSGFADGSDAAQLATEGLYASIRKPYRQKELAQLIAQATR